jgi:hypothetical protein
MRFLGALLTFFLALFLLAACATTQPSSLESQAVTTLSPTAYVTTTGASGGQPVANLATQDQSGSQNDWNKYVEFNTPGTAKYAGYRRYTVPTSVTPSSITGIQVKANFLGPAANNQKWTWKLYNWSNSTWITLGDNTGASWSAWKSFTFSATGTLANYVSSTREVRVRIESNNTSDDADLDYEAVVITTSTTPTSGWLSGPTTFSYRIATPFTTSENPPYAVVGVDLFDNSAAVISGLKSKGKVVICYFSSQYEEWRPDFVAVQNDPALQTLLIGPLDTWAGEQWVDIHSFTPTSTLPQHVLLRNIMSARIQTSKNNGCDAVDPDNVDEYNQDNTDTPADESVRNDAGQKITATDQYNYNKWLADTAHAQGLKIMLKNDLDQIANGSEVPAGQPGLAQIFDGVINEECFAYTECSKLEPFKTLGKPIFVVEYQLPRTFPNATDTQTANTLHLNVSYYLRNSETALQFHPDTTFGTW